jgi:hypothetical protein
MGEELNNIKGFGRPKYRKGRSFIADYRDILGTTRNMVLYCSPNTYIGWNVIAYERIGTRVIFGDAYFEGASESEITIFQPYFFHGDLLIGDIC